MKDQIINKFTQKECPFQKKCKYKYKCYESIIYKYWDNNKAKCVLRANVPLHHKRAAMSFKTRISYTGEKMKVVDENGKVMSNKELRKKYGQGKGVRKG